MEQHFITEIFFLQTLWLINIFYFPGEVAITGKVTSEVNSSWKRVFLGSVQPSTILGYERYTSAVEKLVQEKTATWVSE